MTARRAHINDIFHPEYLARCVYPQAGPISRRVVGQYVHEVYDTAFATVLIDGQPVELTPADPRWRELGLDRTSLIMNRHLANSMVEIDPQDVTQR